MNVAQGSQTPQKKEFTLVAIIIYSPAEVRPMLIHKQKQIAMDVIKKGYLSYFIKYMSSTSLDYDKLLTPLVNLYYGLSD